MHKLRGLSSKKSANVTLVLVETILYAAFVVAYYFLILHFLGGWLKRLYQDHRLTYAITALALIIAQGILLDFLTRSLLVLIRGREQEKGP